MNYLMILLPKLGVFLILILIGFCVSRAGVIKKEGLTTLSSMIINVAMPLLIVSIMNQHETTFMDLFSYRKMVASQMIGYFLLAAAGITVSKIMRLDRRTGNVHRGCMVGGNYAFVVIPLIMALFTAEDGQQYIPICSAVDTITVWVLAISLFTQGIETDESRIRMIAEKLLHPIMIAILSMLILNSLSVKLPGVVLEVCDMVGNTSYTLGLVYVGAVIFYMNKGRLDLFRNMIAFVLSKLIIVPFIVFVIVSRFMPETESIILMLVAGSPTFTVSCVIAEQYRLDQEYAATLVFFSTVGCLVTIPILFVLISFIQ